MLRAILITLLIGVSGFAMAEETPDSSNHKELARLAEKIRSGEIDVGKDYSMNVKTGRFHVIHADKLMLDCTSCHQGKAYRKDYLLIGKDEPYPANARGQYQRSVCLGCHQKGGMARRWYNSSTEP